MKSKKIFTVILFAVLFAAMTVLFSSCDKETKSGYVSDEEREAHILTLLGGSLDNVMDPADYTAVKASGEKNDPNKALGIIGMSKIMSNDNYSLYYDFEDTSFAVVDETTGMVYHTDPTNAVTVRGSALSTANDSERGKLQSPISIEAYDALNKRYEFNFYQNCYEDKNFYVTKLDDNTIRIVYTIGNDPDKDLVPPVVTVSTWNWIMEQISKLPDASAQKSYESTLLNCYKMFTPDSLDIDVKEQYLAYYPTLDYETLWVVRSLTSRQKKKVKEALESIGFTVQMLKAEMEKVDYSGPERAVMYTIPVDITLDEEGLLLNVDTSLILAPSKQKLYKIYFYRAFGGVSGTENYDYSKYLILPDGSGAIMPTQGNMTTDSYTSRVYGADQTFSQDVSTTVSAPAISGFGIYERGDSRYDDEYGRLGGSMMMVLEDGNAQAFISARPYNETNNAVATLNFDLVYSERDYRTYSGGQSTGTEAAAMGDSSGSGVVLAKDETIANFVIRYMFGEGGKTYSEYAAEYRDYLISKGKLPAEPMTDAATQLYIDIVSSFEKTESVAGVPVTKVKALTTYNDVIEILEKLKADGIENVNARYLYWSNGGYFNTAYTEVELLNVLGSKKELSTLLDYVQTNGVGFFPNVELQYVYRDTMTDGFNYSQDAARRLDMRLARVNERSLATGAMSVEANTYKTILSPDVLPELAVQYEESYAKVVGINQISLGSIGEYLNSNYKTNRNVNRTKAMEYQLKALETFKDYEIIVDNGNDYTWAYAEHILNLPMGSSEYLSSLESIPFIQMVLHGYINYASEAFNQKANYSDILLECLETGSNVYFKWMAANDTIFYNTDFNDWYSLNYENSYDKAVALYKEISSVLDNVAGCTIKEHCNVDSVYVAGGEITYLQPGDEGYREGRKTVKEDTRVFVDGVYKTVYSNGLTVYVNYNTFDIQFVGESEQIVTVAARDYLIIE